jgi:predicted regulator of Ras-like GTPase activity (Roadblock/LC7/MglB family)
MKKTLDELCGMQGVNGAFLLSEEGALLEFSAPPIYDRELLAQAAATLTRATDSMSVQHNNWETLVAHYDQEKLYVVRMEGSILCVIADGSLNLPFLNVAIKVAKKKLLKRLSGNASGMDASGAALSGYSSQFSSAYGSQGPVGVPNPLNQHAAHGSGFHPAMERTSGMSGSVFPEGSGMFWSGLGGTGMQSSAVSVADEASSKLLSKISEALATVVGPMAKVFVKEAVRKICPSAPFNMRDSRLLLAEIEQQHLADPDDLQEFRSNFHQ